jgi:glyoxylase-like metal-dependent hydrolase (beta-lactamase superfamily II)
MAFELVQLTDNIFHLQSGANCGLIAHEGRAVLIDAGLDDDAGRRIRKALESLGLRLEVLLLTHGHADHFGGASYLRRNLPPFVVGAPPVERAFIENSALEGIMLSAGALPFDQLNSKFTRAPACAVDADLLPGAQTFADLPLELEVIALTGHSPQQIGVRCGDVFFTADAFLPTVTLAKYPVPFTAHIGRALETLEAVRALTEAEGLTLAAGHGAHLRGDEAQNVVAANRAALLRVVEATGATLRARGPLDEAALTQAVCTALGDGLSSAAAYYLARATVQAACVYLYEAGQAALLTGGRVAWEAR